MSAGVTRIRQVIVILATTALMVALGAALLSSMRSDPLPETLGQAPEFSFTTSTGAQLSSEELRGKIWLMNFFFTSCPGPCPLINSELKKLMDTKWIASKVRIVSLTVDPERDDPARLAEYAKRYSASPGSWDFVTGEPEKIRSVIEGGFKLIAPDDVSLHTTRIALVDETGAIRGFYQGTDQESLKAMFRDVAALVKASQ